jgi:hypothetical protein
MKVSRMCIKSLVAGFIFLALPLLVSAQGFQLDGPQPEKTELGIRFLHPDFEYAEGLSLLSGLYQFTVNIAVSPKVNLVGSVPMGTLGGDDMEAQTGIGNIYAGIQYKLKETDRNSASLSLGVYLPTANKDKPMSSFMGMCANYSRCFQFMPEVVTVSMNLTYYHNYQVDEEGWFWGSELGPHLLIPKEEDYYNDEMELFVHYGLTGGYRFKLVEIKAEYTGIGIITEKVDDLGDRFYSEIILGAKWNRGHVRPGVFYKINLNQDIRDVVRGAFGISFDFMLK